MMVSIMKKEKKTYNIPEIVPSDLFQRMTNRVKEYAKEYKVPEFKAFGYWFANVHFNKPDIIKLESWDGKGDGKADFYIEYKEENKVKFCLLNMKYTEEYSNNKTNHKVYEELQQFIDAFRYRENREKYLESVRTDLKDKYNKILNEYDNANVKLFFVTNKYKGDRHVIIQDSELECFHLGDLLQSMIAFLDDAMPKTPDLILTQISKILPASDDLSKVPTTILFAKIHDFIKYMQKDPYELLFARNVRLIVGRTPVNADIAETYTSHPEEFVYSNNGITLLCDDLNHKTNVQQAIIVNPRVVNGSQTLHSVKLYSTKYNDKARVMVKVIEIKPPDVSDFSNEARIKRQVVKTIAERTNKQNTITVEDLVSNDVFHIELDRYFRRFKIFYDRRKNSWKEVYKKYLKDEGIVEGPNLTTMMQIIASYYWDNKKLGPGIAKAKKKDLFSVDQYDIITKTENSISYQCYLIYQLILKTKKHLNKSGKDIFTAFNYAILSYVIRCLQNTNHVLGDRKISDLLNSINEKKFLEFIKILIKYFNSQYEKYLKEKNLKIADCLPYDFIKIPENVSSIVQGNLNNEVMKKFKEILK